MKIADIVFVYQMNDEKRISWHGRRHSHTGLQHECHYFISGDGSFKNGTQTWSIRTGDIHFTAPGVEHQIIPAYPGKPITYYAVLLDAETGNERSSELELLERLAGKTGNVSGPHHIGTSHRFFFADLLERHFSGSPDLVRASLHQYMSLLYSIAGGNPSGASTTDNIHVEKALAIFHKSIEEDLDLEALAARLGVSQEHIARLFVARMGMPPMKYYRRLKVEAACAMLASTNLRIGRIAESLSFRDQFAFARTFRSITGVSPSAYRTHCLQLADFSSDVKSREYALQ